jgi:hypothetical protein
VIICVLAATIARGRRRRITRAPAMSSLTAQTA